MFPAELKQLKQWCIWRFHKRNGKTTKLPYNAHDNSLAKSNDESTWSDYETATQAMQEFQADGVGFFFKPPYIGIDIDDIASELDRYKKNDIETNLVYEFIESFKSYTEISPSGNGLHIIAKGTIPGDRRRHKNVEMYDTGRFFTMTGKTIGKYKNVSEASETTMKRIYRKHIEPQSGKVIQGNFNDHGITHNLSETEIIHSILRSSQADDFKSFMNGGWEKEYPSQSEADLAFANLLAFWCGRDYVKMDVIFRQSSLMRPKWDEKRGKLSYGEGTLNKAIHDTQNVFTPKKDEPKKYEFNFGNKTKEEQELPARSWDDTGNAERFMDNFGDLVRYSYVNKKFYAYDGAKWATDDKGIVRSLIDATNERMKHEKIHVPDGMDEEEAQLAFQKFIKTCRNNSRKKALEDELKHRVSVLPEEFDKDDMLLNVGNGYLDLTNGALEDHDLKKMFTRQANAEYTDTMDCPIWEDFLNDIFDSDTETIRYIQKAIGYSLTGSTKEQVMFILHGVGRNGKSLFIETISEILGSYAQNIQAKTLMVKRNETVNNDIAVLKGDRFVSSSEPSEGFRFDEGLVKQLTGGDKVTARHLYGENFQFTPKFKIWVSTNHKPIIRGTDDGIWRRMVLIPFNVQIPEHKVDKDLKWKLLREAPAILNWALEGCLMWQKEGLDMPDMIEKASQNYRREMDILDGFIYDCCEVGEGYKVRAKEFYQAYKRWVKENGEYEYSNTKFGKEMGKKFSKEKDREGLYYEGIRLIPLQNRQKYPLNLN